MDKQLMMQPGALQKPHLKEIVDKYLLGVEA